MIKPTGLSLAEKCVGRLGGEHMAHRDACDDMAIKGNFFFGAKLISLNASQLLTKTTMSNIRWK